MVGRRCRVLHGHGRIRRSRFRFRPARQCGDGAPRAGSDDRCWQVLASPILSIRRRRGRLVNALPELAHAAASARFSIHAPCPSRSPRPRADLCNESQALCLAIGASAARSAIASGVRSPSSARQRRANGDRRRPALRHRPVADLDVLLGNPPKMTRDVAHATASPVLKHS